MWLRFSVLIIKSDAKKQMIESGFGSTLNIASTTRGLYKLSCRPHNDGSTQIKWM